MKGQVLDYSIQKNEGIIASADEGRYTFSGAEWKGTSPPARGLWVDFEAQGSTAAGVYLALGTSTGGVRASLSAPSGSSTKSKPAITLLAIVLGGLGAHKFYMGSWGWGIVYLVTVMTGLPFIVAMVEWVRYILMTDDEFQAKVAEFQSKGPGPFSFFW